MVSDVWIETSSSSVACGGWLIPIVRRDTTNEGQREARSRRRSDGPSRHSGQRRDRFPSPRRSQRGRS